MVKFDLIKPDTIEEACDFLNDHPEDSKVKAAGLSLLILLKQRLFHPRYLINIEGISGLRYIEEKEDGGLKIGALTTHRDIETSPLINKKFYVLKEMELDLGSVQVRNRGTIGGCICHSEPLSDVPPVMIALGGKAICLSTNGERAITFENFFKDYYENALKPNEILKEIYIPPNSPYVGCSYIKHTLRKAMDKPYVGVAVCMNIEGQTNICRDIKVVIGAIAPTPFRAIEVERFLLNSEIDELILEKASELVSFDGLDIVYDLRCTEEYKKDVTRVIIRRALKIAFSRAKSNNNS